MKIKIITSFLAVVLLLAGCMGTNANEEGSKMKGNTKYENTSNRDGMNNNQNLTDNVNNRKDMKNNDRDKDSYEISREAADRIVSEINEIQSAYVLTTNNQAYVAARLDTNDNTSTENNRSNTGISNDTNRSNMTDMENNNNTDTRDNADMSHNTNMGQGEEVTEEVKDKITKIVQKTNPNIKNVYVTTSPDFIDLVNNYSDDVDNGKPIRGMFDQMGNMIERLFPQNNR